MGSEGNDIKTHIATFEFCCDSYSLNSCDGHAVARNDSTTSTHTMTARRQRQQRRRRQQERCRAGPIISGDGSGDGSGSISSIRTTIMITMTLPSRLTLLFLSCLIAATTIQLSLAGPASLAPVIERQPDGSLTPPLLVRGDHRGHVVTDEGGRMVELDDDGWYVYVDDGSVLGGKHSGGEWGDGGGAGGSGGGLRARADEDDTRGRERKQRRRAGPGASLTGAAEADEAANRRRQQRQQQQQHRLPPSDREETLKAERHLAEMAAAKREERKRKRRRERRLNSPELWKQNEQLHEEEQRTQAVPEEGGGRPQPLHESADTSSQTLQGRSVLSASSYSYSNPSGGFRMKILVVPIVWSDQLDRERTSLESIDILFNSPTPHEKYCPTGSVRGTYLEYSYGHEEFESYVLPEWIEVSQTEQYSSGGVSGFSMVVTEALVEALNAVDNRGLVRKVGYEGQFQSIRDFDGVAFLHTGYGAEFYGKDCVTGAPTTDRLWVHARTFPYQPPSATSWEESFTVMYILASSHFGKCGSNVARIGMISHELGHLLGLVDLYGLMGDTGIGLGYYDVMAYAWGRDNSQLRPPHPSAYTKITAGWVEPRIVHYNGRYRLRPISEYPDVIKVMDGTAEGEYFLVEYRRPVGLDKDLRGDGGLAFYHVDEEVGMDSPGYPGQVDENGVSWPECGDHYRVGLMAADGRYDLEKGNGIGDRGDLWHAGSQRSELGPSEDQDNDGYGDSYGGGQGVRGYQAPVSGPYPNTDSYRNGIIRRTGIRFYDISEPGTVMAVSVDGLRPGEVEMEDWEKEEVNTVTTGFAVVAPTNGPTRVLTNDPTDEPTRTPTTGAPTNRPTRTPTNVPTRTPTTRAPTNRPTRTPTTLAPTNRPTRTPTTLAPTNRPTRTPTTLAPTSTPTTRAPTNGPTRKPTRTPTTRAPTVSPTTRRPTTDAPTRSPKTRGPTDKPTTPPTDGPTRVQTREPTDGPTFLPTDEPTTNEPTNKPTFLPTDKPRTNEPTNKPIAPPTDGPTNDPTGAPVRRPTFGPTDKPTDKPSMETAERIVEPLESEGLKGTEGPTADARDQEVTFAEPDSVASVGTDSSETTYSSSSTDSQSEDYDKDRDGSEDEDHSDKSDEVDEIYDEHEESGSATDGALYREYEFEEGDDALHIRRSHDRKWLLYFYPRSVVNNGVSGSGAPYAGVAIGLGQVSPPGNGVQSAPPGNGVQSVPPGKGL